MRLAPFLQAFRASSSLVTPHTFESLSPLVYAPPPLPLEDFTPKSNKSHLPSDLDLDHFMIETSTNN
jgi:hypothetical protein